jgi:demethylmenaquinone methyltransferase / 2-methoxy-6-polyprenyl-1,4-benzoquinol methylase
MYQHDSIVPLKESPESKKEQVAGMFNRIAGKYDFFNRFLSGGTDIRWRKKALKQFENNPPQHLLDVATGTADMAIMAEKMLHPPKITGIDISEKMLEIGREKVKKAGYQNVINLETGDSETINYPPATFDAITAAFGVRNFANLEKGLAEMYRVLKPGGKLVILEFCKPKRKGWRKIYNIYMAKVAPKIVTAFSGNREAYHYLDQSVKAFPEREDFVAILKKTGFINTGHKPLSLGICCIYSGIK